MVKILSIQLYKAPAGSGQATQLCSVNDLSSFSFYQKPAIGEFLTFLSTTVASRTPTGSRQSVEKDAYTAHVYHHSSGIIGIIVSDAEYPPRVAFSLLSKILEEFSLKFSKTDIDSGKLNYPELNDYIVKYQDPKQADTILKVQQELDETKVILHKTIEQVLERGEKLDDLVERSNNLSNTSKMFYKSAKKQNSCCVIA
ncbi:snare-like protein [Atractiella rhizophila]|nr:snare-like protein [Atractiella rhizophila]